MRSTRSRRFEELATRSHLLVTGGSSGIGRAVARRLLDTGGTIHLVARGEPGLEEACRDLGSVRTHACDVSDPDAVALLFGRLRDEGMLPSVVVNCAGVTRPGRFESLSAQDFRDVMDTNFFGTLHVLREAVPEMLARREGYVLNVSSVAGLMGVYGMSAYSAAKFAVRGLTETLRSELKPHGIVVSLLCPPDTDTPMLRREVPLRPPETEALSPSDAAIPAHRVARAAVRGLARGDRLILPGASARLPALGRRLAPGLMEWAMDRIVRRVRSGEGPPDPARHSERD